MDIRVRKAKAEDVESMLALKLEASTILLTKLGHSLAEIGSWQERFATVDYMKQHVRSPHSLYVLEQDGELQAMGGLTLKDDGDDSTCYLGNMYAKVLGKGFGSLLMQYRLGVMENFNVDFLTCHVHSENDRARRFVEHYGFELHGSYAEKRLGSTQVVYRKY